ncbi:hypothetical protein [Herbidospora galbida]
MGGGPSPPFHDFVPPGHRRTGFLGLAVEFSPDGRTLAVARDNGTAQLWNVARREVIAILETSGEVMRSVWDRAFSPDGRILATVGGNKMLELWDITSGAEIAALKGHTGAVYSVTFSPDGKTLAHSRRRQGRSVVGPRPAHADRHADRTRRRHLGRRLQPDGRTLATASADRTARLWDLTRREAIAVLNGHTSAVNGLAFSPDGTTLATVGNDGTARF